MDTPTDPPKNSPSSGDNDESDTLTPLEPVIELRVQRTNASREELDDEAVVLMQILRDCIINSNQLTGFLAGQPEATSPIQAEVSMLDATSSYLISILGQSAYGRARPTIEQVRRRVDIYDRHAQVINRMRRLPERSDGDERCSQEGKSRFLQLTPVQQFGNRIEPPIRDLLQIMGQFDGASLEDSQGSTSIGEEEQADVDAPGQGASCANDVD